tara:strand:- start:174 stop:473 length:300 start_codon:yes stop_codon:yes gene_type:complete
MSIFINVYAITLWPFIFIRDEGNQRTITHEKIHIKQQIELWVLGFYIMYLIDWIKGLRIYGDPGAAYVFIRFEQEAYRNENDIEYPDNREKFAWRSYNI